MLKGRRKKKVKQQMGLGFLYEICYKICNDTLVASWKNPITIAVLRNPDKKKSQEKKKNWILNQKCLLHKSLKSHSN